jgi:transcription initiation factor TFIID subunit TAF12
VGRFLSIVLLTVGMSAAGIYQVHDRYEVVRLGYALDDARQAQQSLLESQKRLRLRYDTTTHPNQVTARAADLQMKRAGAREEYLVPNPGKGSPESSARTMVEAIKEEGP